ncbi:EF hand family protein [Corchorus olitorius]|uniref:EF hand family protein n=1 Tax=Corchorus olitorius TaxID=93759 RepID=A0A1R3KHI1_9ROSI|nr:EF hand family protein [Corchorus olitorius]
MNRIYEAARIWASNPRLHSDEEEFWHHFPELFKILAADRQGAEKKCDELQAERSDSIRLKKLFLDTNSRIRELACPFGKEIRLQSRLTETKNEGAVKMAEIAVMEAEIANLAKKRREIAKGQLAILKDQVKNSIPFLPDLKKIDDERESLKLQLTRKHLEFNSWKIKIAISGLIWWL